MSSHRGCVAAGRGDVWERRLAWEQGGVKGIGIYAGASGSPYRRLYACRPLRAPMDGESRRLSFLSQGCEGYPVFLHIVSNRYVVTCGVHALRRFGHRDCGEELCFYL